MVLFLKFFGSIVQIIAHYSYTILFIAPKKDLWVCHFLRPANPFHLLSGSPGKNIIIGFVRAKRLPHPKIKVSIESVELQQLLRTLFTVSAWHTEFVSNKKVLWHVYTPPTNEIILTTSSFMVEINFKMGLTFEKLVQMENWPNFPRPISDTQL